MLSLILGIITFGLMFVITQAVCGLTDYFCIKKGWMKSAMQRTDEEYLYQRIGCMTVRRLNPYYINEKGERPHWRLESCLPESLKKPYF